MRQIREAIMTEIPAIMPVIDAAREMVLAFFMCLGIGLKFIPGMPIEFFAGFYPGLGTALSIAGIRYFISWCKAI